MSHGSATSGSREFFNHRLKRRSAKANEHTLQTPTSAHLKPGSPITPEAESIEGAHA